MLNTSIYMSKINTCAPNNQRIILFRESVSAVATKMPFKSVYLDFDSGWFCRHF